MFKVKIIHLILTAITLCVMMLAQQPVAASPFGMGVFGADVPFGSETNMSIALGSNVNFTLSGFPTISGSGSHTITVTSTDVVGYKLYIYAPAGTALTSGASTIPASGNTSAGPLSNNTWGYNTDGSSNYVGMTTTPVAFKTAIGPFKNGDSTIVTYGVLTDFQKRPSNYTINVTYTAVAMND
jgi:hypothetical protein